jgi:hypothetical protein
MIHCDYLKDNTFREDSFMPAHTKLFQLMHSFCLNFVDSVNLLTNHYLTHGRKLQVAAGLNRFREKLAGKVHSSSHS